MVRSSKTAHVVPQSKHYPLRSTLLPPRCVWAIRVSELHLELSNPTGKAGMERLSLAPAVSTDIFLRKPHLPALSHCRLTCRSHAIRCGAGLGLRSLWACIVSGQCEVGADFPQVMIEPTAGEGFSGNSCSESRFGQRQQSPLA